MPTPRIPPGYTLDTWHFCDTCGGYGSFHDDHWQQEVLCGECEGEGGWPVLAEADLDSLGSPPADFDEELFLARSFLDPIGDLLRSLPIVGTLYIDNPHDPRNKELRM